MRRVPIAIAVVLMVVTAALYSSAQGRWLTSSGVPRRVSTTIIPPVAEKMPIFVDHTGRDAAGRAFVAGLKNGLKASNRFALADDETGSRVVVVIVSVSPAPTSRLASAISLAYVANNEHRSLLASAARFVGRDRAETMGRETVAELTSVLDAYQPSAAR